MAKYSQADIQAARKFQGAPWFSTTIPKSVLNPPKKTVKTAKKPMSVKKAVKKYFK
jgi:hypothetical protein